MVFTTVVYRYITPSFDSHYGELHKTQPYRIKKPENRNIFLISEPEKMKLFFLWYGNKPQIINYMPNWANALHWQNKFSLWKNEIEGQFAFFGGKGITVILVHCNNFVQKTTLKTGRCFNVDSWSKNRRWKHNVVTTLVFGWSDNVGNLTLWEFYDQR